MRYCSHASNASCKLQFIHRKKTPKLIQLIFAFIRFARPPRIDFARQILENFFIRFTIFSPLDDSGPPSNVPSRLLLA